MAKAVNIPTNIVGILRGASVLGSEEAPVLVLNAPSLPRDVYAAVDKVLRALGGRWDRKVGGHVFSRPLEGPLAEALASGRAVDVARSADQFFTPSALSDKLADLASVQAGQTVLEPSAGAGALVDAALSRGAIVTAVEQDPRLVDRLRAKYQSGAVDVLHGDFAAWGAPAQFDVVLMNPPFSSGQDMAHVARAFTFLRPGGILAAIMSPHWTFAQEAAARNFREWAGAHSWEPLPEHSFKGSGTLVSTGILVAHKPR